jgi:hypothetical protein
MHFIDFIKTLPKQEDTILEQLRNSFTHDEHFPVTSDVNILAEYLWNKLDNKQTTKYQSMLMIWTLQKGQNPNLEDINCIIDVQHKWR